MKNGSALFIPVAGEPVAILAAAEVFTLEELQGLIGGYIQLIPLSLTRLLVVNEEGLPLGLQANDHATRLLVAATPPDRRWSVSQVRGPAVAISTWALGWGENTEAPGRGPVIRCGGGQ